MHEILTVYICTCYFCFNLGLLSFYVVQVIDMIWISVWPKIMFIELKHLSNFFCFSN